MAEQPDIPFTSGTPVSPCKKQTFLQAVHPRTRRLRVSKLYNFQSLSRARDARRRAATPASPTTRYVAVAVVAVTFGSFRKFDVIKGPVQRKGCRRRRFPPFHTESSQSQLQRAAAPPHAHTHNVQTRNPRRKRTVSRPL